MYRISVKTNNYVMLWNRLNMYHSQLNLKKCGIVNNIDVKIT